MRHLATALILALAGCAPAPAPQLPRLPERPNILVLFADDLRRDALGAFGSTAGATPHLDALAARGFAFDRAECMGSRHGAVCMPSRAMLLSGRALTQVRDDLAGAGTFPEALRASGYATSMTGKWHNGEASLKRSFPDAKAVFLGGMADHFHVPLVDVTAGAIANKRTGDRHSSELFADATIEFLRDHASAGRQQAPFVFYAAFTAPHDPRDAPLEFRERFYRDLPPLPRNFRGQHGLDLGAQTMTVRDEQLLPWPRPPELVRQQLAEYLALVAHLDEQIGRILAELERTGLAESTLVVFAADQGLALGSHGLLGKQSLYQHSMGAPVLLAGPGVPHGGSHALVYLFDLCATICDAAGSPPPDGAAGRSLLPLLQGGDAACRQYLFTLYADTQRAVRDERYELIRLPQIDRTLLFDLRADPDELHDLAGDPARAADLQRLAAALREQQAVFADPLPWTAANVLPAEIDLSGQPRQPDRCQPQWIRDKYFR